MKILSKLYKEDKVKDLYQFADWLLDNRYEKPHFQVIKNPNPYEKYIEYLQDKMMRQKV